jgi:hypothetical protein
LFCDVAIGAAQQRGQFERVCMKKPVANAQDRAVPSAIVKPHWKRAPHVAVDAEGAWTSQTASRVGKSSGLDRGQLGPADHEPGACVHSLM